MFELIGKFVGKVVRDIHNGYYIGRTEEDDDGYADSIELDSETHQANLDRKHSKRASV